MKKLLLIAAIFAAFQNFSSAQETKTYGLCAYSLNGTEYISNPMRTNKDWGKGGFMQSGYSKIQIYREGIENEFRAKLAAQFNIALPKDNYTGPGNLTIWTDGPTRLLPGIDVCSGCLWTYDQAKTAMQNEMTIVVGANKKVMVVK